MGTFLSLAVGCLQEQAWDGGGAAEKDAGRWRSSSRTAGGGDEAKAQPDFGGAQWAAGTGQEGNFI